MATNSKKIKVAELFAGVGGFRIGLEKASSDRYETVWFNQWEPGKKKQHAHEVYLRHWGDPRLEHTNTDLEEVVKKYIHAVPDHDLLVGGFPCQDYSVAKPLRQSQGLIGKKGVLWWSIVSLVKQLQETPRRKAPKILFLENVDRLLKSPGNQRGRDFAIMLRSLATLGYDVEWRVVNAADYGFPQRRRRVFILAYHERTGISRKMRKLGHAEWLRTGLMGRAFPINFDSKLTTHIDLYEDEKQISDTFGLGKKVSPFENAGTMIRGVVSTERVTPDHQGPQQTLAHIILPDKEVIDVYGHEYFIDDPSALQVWRTLKGPKRLERINRMTGETYFFSEGGMSFPDPLDKPSRTIVTGEGGSGPSRFKHVIASPESGRLRRLTPLELERLCMFPDHHTAEGMSGGISANTRAFFMGNALVTGVITSVGEELLRHVDEYGL